MDNLTECKYCGYKKRKNSNRTINSISINITVLEGHILKVLYSKWDIPLCNICTDTLVIINKELIEQLNV